MENYLKGEQRVEMLLQSRLITYPPLIWLCTSFESWEACLS